MVPRSGEAGCAKIGLLRMRYPKFSARDSGRVVTVLRTSLGSLPLDRRALVHQELNCLFEETLRIDVSNPESVSA